MRSRKKLLKSSLVYAIIDKEVLKHRPLSSVAKELLGLKVSIMQLRDKVSSKKMVLSQAEGLSRILAGSNSLFIINDFVDIAQIVRCDGVHLGQDDLPIEYARKLLGKNKLIGISCHSFTQAQEAQNKGADYIGIGPVFSTLTKPEYTPVGCGLLQECKGKITIPYFAIGGITAENTREIKFAGANRIAVAGGLLNAKDINKAVRDYRRALNS